MKYVLKGAREGPKEERKPAKKFDDEANTAADILAEINISHNIKTQADCSTIIKNTTEVGEIRNDDKASRNDSAGPKASAKSQLMATFAANKWKPPLFECFKEEGPWHKKLFTYKIVMEIEGEASSTVLECFGDPKSKKKTAAESAAEGALWYLKHLGYFPIKKSHEVAFEAFSTEGIILNTMIRKQVVQDVKD
ncbi:unnamed protein product [Dovyalis caffra]|uniref:DRBM domain-containing protein n=1 Tax=Dovyalis caffra TaxID=77055 RepID=A0AAV1RKK3_9ROSI|nr:unnamed protein product [Dovyalis caffra]